MSRQPRMWGEEWPEEDTLEVLHMIDHEGKTRGEVARLYGVSRNAIIGLYRRVMRESYRAFPGDVGDGTMPPRWWVR